MEESTPDSVDRRAQGTVENGLQARSLEEIECSKVTNGGHATVPSTRVYKKRWLIVFLFSAYSLTNAYQWIQYGIISNIITGFYGVDSFAVDWLSMIYMLAYIPLIFPVTWILDKKGLRFCALVANAINCAGTWIKVASVRPGLFWLTMLGQGAGALSQVFILGIPSNLASVWFGADEVSTACAIGVFGNQVREWCHPPFVLLVFVENRVIFNT